MYIASRLYRQIRPARRLSLVAAKRLARSASPIALGGIFDAVLPSIITLFLASISGAVAVAHFGAASRVVGSTYFLGSALVAATLPLLAKADTAGPRAFLGVYLPVAKALLAMLVPLGAAFVLFAGTIARAVLGHHLTDAASAIQLLGPTVVLAGIALLSTAGLIVRNRQRALPWISVAVLAQTVVLVLIVVPRHASAAAAVTLASEFTYTVALAAFVLRAPIAQIRPGRLTVGPTTAAGAMVLTHALTGDTWLGLLGGLAAYLVVLFTVERLLFPADLHAALGRRYRLADRRRRNRAVRTNE